MHLLYSIALSLLFLALLPYFLYQAARHGKYAGSFRERLGFLPSSLRNDGRKTIWVHAVSVGELIAARPLISGLKRDMPDHRIVISTTTLTGQRLARAYHSGDVEGVFYFPFDWSLVVRRTLHHVQPDTVVLIETELWPNFLRQCRLSGVPTVVASGRLSQRSFARYGIVSGFISRVMGDVSMLVMQSEADAERARLLGANPGQLLVCGNIKYDVVVGAAESPGAELDIGRRLALSDHAHLIVAGSTAEGEEEIVLEALRIVRRAGGLEDTRLVIAPRRPERFDEVADLIARSGFKLGRRSRLPPPDDDRRGITTRPLPLSEEKQAHPPPAAEVILLDSIGELAEVYRHATVVFVGGSLVPRGGHNIIEPAAYAKPIVVGPNMENFRQIVSDFTAGNALVQVIGSSPEALAGALTSLLSDSVQAAALGARARAILDRSRGATECTLKAIRTVMRLT
jgi:3-deoxy-D-manno-octulosonic-acid transferase